MANKTQELAFETAIADSLHASGWVYENNGNASGFDPALALHTDDVEHWLSTQYPDEWEKAVPEKLSAVERAVAVKRLMERLAELLDKSPQIDRTRGGSTGGLLGVLRDGFKHMAGMRSTGRSEFDSMVEFYPANPLVTAVTERADANRLRVIRQVRFDTASTETLDLVLLVNGIPVVTLELKTDNTQSIVDAVEQYKIDRVPGPTRRLLAPGRALVHFAVSNAEVQMTTALRGADTKFLPFNQGNGEHGGNPVNPNGSETAYLWEKVLSPRQFLRIIQSYAVWKPGDNKKAGNLIFPRFHQLRAVERVTRDVEDNGVGRRYLIQHSAGSGKTMTISWLAHRLSRHYTGTDKTFDSIIVISDRQVLDRNLRDGIDLLHASMGKVVQVGVSGGAKSPVLAKALEEGNKIITCTLQTFPEVISRIQKSGTLGTRNWCVIADEAHSSQTGDAAKKLRELLTTSTQSAPVQDSEPNDGDGTGDVDDMLLATSAAVASSANITYVAFTATPKPKTLRLFGSETEDGRFVPFDTYSMAQAIEEGFILDVLTNYTPYRSFIEVQDAMGRSDLVDKGEVVGEIVRFARKHPTSIAQKVRVVVEHFRANVRSLMHGQARAMVVTGSRKEAVTWSQKMDEYIAEKGYKDVHSLVAFSGTVTDDNGEEYTESSMNAPVTDVETAFKDSQGNYRVLIVAEKFQTGFDEKRLCAMYVDKGLSGVATVQTLSRLNRIADNKPAPIVLDFVNDPQSILNDFRAYYSEAYLPEDVDPVILFDLADQLDTAGLYTHDDLTTVGEVYFSDDEKDGHENLRAALSPVVGRFNEQMTQARKTDNSEEVERLQLFRSNLLNYVKTWEFLSQIVDFADPDMAKRAVLAKYVHRNISDAGGVKSLDLSGVDVIGAQTFEADAAQDLGLTSGDGELDSQLAVPTFGGGVAAEGTVVKIAFDTAVEEANEILAQYGYTDDDSREILSDLYRHAIGEPLVTTMAKENTTDQLASAPAFGEAVDAGVVDSVMRRENHRDIYFADTRVAEVYRRALAQMVHTAVNADKDGN